MQSSKSDVPATMTEINKFEVLKLLVELAEKESDRSWVRYSMMLYASTGLTAILSFAASSATPILSVAPAVAGIVIAIVWVRMNTLSYYYEHRWHADIEEVVKSEPLLTQWIRGRNNPRIARPYRKSKFPFGFYANMVPVAFLVLWILVLITVSLATIFSFYATGT
ncbi:MAG TPA: hypothetical protein VF707_11595 [Ardenticatenaceae bacterium]|jgi:hypothetical protein